VHQSRRSGGGGSRFLNGTDRQEPSSPFHIRRKFETPKIRWQTFDPELTVLCSLHTALSVSYCVRGSCMPPKAGRQPSSSSPPFQQVNSRAKPCQDNPGSSLSRWYSYPRTAEGPSSAAPAMMQWRHSHFPAQLRDVETDRALQRSALIGRRLWPEQPPGRQETPVGLRICVYHRVCARRSAVILLPLRPLSCSVLPELRAGTNYTN
jgi:hypothetical protein